MSYRIPALTSVRCGAALLVFLFHYASVARLLDSSLAGRLLAEGRFGVTLFFVLSGFLLTARYIDAQVGLGTYALKRLARIAPLYWTLCAAFFVWNLANGQVQLTEAPVYFSLTQGFFYELQHANIGVAWSLTVEESFYLSLPLLLIGLRLAWTWVQPTWRNLVGAALVLGLFFVAWYQLGRLLRSQEMFTAWGFMRSTDHWRAYTLCGRGAEFGLGCWFAMVYVRTSNRWLKEARWVDGVLVGATAALLVGFATLGGAGIETTAGWRMNLVWAALGAVIIYALCSPVSRIAGALSARPLVYGGKISFAFYLIHLHVIQVGVPWIAAPWWVELPLLLAVSAAIAALLYERIERPAHRWILARAERTAELTEPRYA